MNLTLMLTILICHQEQYSLPPSNSTAGVRLLIIVPEPLEQSMVELKLEAIEGNSISTRNPTLVKGKGWRLLHEPGDRWLLQRVDTNETERPVVRWPWRQNTEDAWHESQWDDLYGSVPLAGIPHRVGSNLRWPWWMLIVGEGLATILIVLSIMISRRINDPANRLRRKLSGVSSDFVYWSILHQFIQDYLKKTWNCHGHHIIYQWHAQRHDPDLGRRLELLLESLAEARYGPEVIQVKGLPDDWIQWLTDAGKVRSRRL
jgi:hypothetical protein